MSDEQKKSPGIEKWMGYVAVLVATVAAFSAMYEARVNREHAKIEVWPYLQMWAGLAPDATSEDENNKFEFFIANKGVGPAIVEHLEVRWREETYNSLGFVMLALADEAGLSRSSLQLGEANMEPGEVIEAGEARWWFNTNNRELAIIMARELYGKETVEVEICYCSLYEDCWELNFPEPRPQPVDTCRRT